ncbi:MAG: hypothetical protein ACI8P9_003061 [Parasphingorhabdus sp.]|jgi:hypothetical protein
MTLADLIRKFHSSNSFRIVLILAIFMWNPIESLAKDFDLAKTNARIIEIDRLIKLNSEAPDSLTPSTLFRIRNENGGYLTASGSGLIIAEKVISDNNDHQLWLIGDSHGDQILSNMSTGLLLHRGATLFSQPKARVYPYFFKEQKWHIQGNGLDRLGLLNRSKRSRFYEKDKRLETWKQTAGVTVQLINTGLTDEPNLYLSKCNMFGSVACQVSQPQGSKSNWILEPATTRQLARLTIDRIKSLQESKGTDGATDVLFEAIDSTVITVLTFGAGGIAGSVTKKLGVQAGKQTLKSLAWKSSRLAWKKGLQAGARHFKTIVTRDMVKRHIRKSAIKKAAKAGAMAATQIAAGDNADTLSEMYFNKVFRGSSANADDLQIKVSNQLVWPQGGGSSKHKATRAGEAHQVKVEVIFEAANNTSIELVEYDSASDNDDLGSLVLPTANIKEKVIIEGGLIVDKDEGSIYEVDFSVEPYNDNNAFSRAKRENAIEAWKKERALLKQQRANTFVGEWRLGYYNTSGERDRSFTWRNSLVQGNGEWQPGHSANATGKVVRTHPSYTRSGKLLPPLPAELRPMLNELKGPANLDNRKVLSDITNIKDLNDLKDYVHFHHKKPTSFLHGFEAQYAEDNEGKWVPGKYVRRGFRIAPESTGEWNFRGFAKWIRKNDRLNLFANPVTGLPGKHRWQSHFSCAIINNFNVIEDLSDPRCRPADTVAEKPSPLLLVERIPNNSIFFASHDNSSPSLGLSPRKRGEINDRNYGWEDEAKYFTDDPPDVEEYFHNRGLENSEELRRYRIDDPPESFLEERHLVRTKYVVEQEFSVQTIPGLTPGLDSPDKSIWMEKIEGSASVSAESASAIESARDTLVGYWPIDLSSVFNEGELKNGVNWYGAHFLFTSDGLVLSWGGNRTARHFGRWSYLGDQSFHIHLEGLIKPGQLKVAPSKAVAKAMANHRDSRFTASSIVNLQHYAPTVVPGIDESDQWWRQGAKALGQDFVIQFGPRQATTADFYVIAGQGHNYLRKRWSPGHIGAKNDLDYRFFMGPTGPGKLLQDLHVLRSHLKIPVPEDEKNRNADSIAGLIAKEDAERIAGNLEKLADAELAYRAYIHSSNQSALYSLTDRTFCHRDTAAKIMTNLVGKWQVAKYDAWGKPLPLPQAETLWTFDKGGQLTGQISNQTWNARWTAVSGCTAKVEFEPVTANYFNVKTAVEVHVAFQRNGDKVLHIVGPEASIPGFDDFLRVAGNQQVDKSVYRYDYDQIVPSLSQLANECPIQDLLEEAQVINPAVSSDAATRIRTVLEALDKVGSAETALRARGEKLSVLVDRIIPRDKLGRHMAMMPDAHFYRVNFTGTDAKRESELMQGVRGDLFVLLDKRKQDCIGSVTTTRSVPERRKVFEFPPPRNVYIESKLRWKPMVPIKKGEEHRYRSGQWGGMSLEDYQEAAATDIRKHQKLVKEAEAYLARLKVPPRMFFDRTASIVTTLDLEPELTPLQIANGCAEHLSVKSIPSNIVAATVTRKIFNSSSSNYYIYDVEEAGAYLDPQPVAIIEPGQAAWLDGETGFKKTILDDDQKCVAIVEFKWGDIPMFTFGDGSTPLVDADHLTTVQMENGCLGITELSFETVDYNSLLVNDQTKSMCSLNNGTRQIANTGDVDLNIHWVNYRGKYNEAEPTFIVKPGQSRPLIDYDRAIYAILGEDNKCVAVVDMASSSTLTFGNGSTPIVDTITNTSKVQKTVPAGNLTTAQTEKGCGMYNQIASKPKTKGWWDCPAEDWSPDEYRAAQDLKIHSGIGGNAGTKPLLVHWLSFYANNTDGESHRRSDAIQTLQPGEPLILRDFGPGDVYSITEEDGTCVATVQGADLQKVGSPYSQFYGGEVREGKLLLRDRESQAELEVEAIARVQRETAMKERTATLEQQSAQTQCGQNSQKKNFQLNELLIGDWQVGPYDILGNKQQFSSSPLLWRMSQFELIGVTSSGHEFSTNLDQQGCNLTVGQIPGMWDDATIKLVSNGNGGMDFFITRNQCYEEAWRMLGDKLMYSGGVLTEGEHLTTEIGSSRIVGCESVDSLQRGPGKEASVLRLWGSKLSNVAPVAENLQVLLNEDSSENISLTASDTDSNSLTFKIIEAPANGTLSDHNGSPTYTPETNFHGTDRFTYIASDFEKDSNIATVSITVTPVNDVPVANPRFQGSRDNADRLVVVDEDSSVAITLTASDSDGDTLTYRVTSRPEYGSLSGTPPEFTYTPQANLYTNPDLSSADRLSYIANDGTSDSNETTLFITINSVNDEPVAESQIIETDEDESLQITINATDSDRMASLSYVLVNGPTHGVLQDVFEKQPFSSGDALDANYLQYRPNENYNGSDSFLFIANDGTTNSEPATVTININPVNDFPVPEDQQVMVAEDSVTTIVLSGKDAEGDTLTYSVVDNPSQGTLQDTDSGLIYTPNKDFIGADSFTFIASDGELESGVSEAATVAITVESINDAPVALDGREILPEDSEEGHFIHLLATDPEGDTLTYRLVSAPGHGSLEVVAGEEITDASVSYTPEVDFHGEDSLTFVASDGQLESNPATVSITVEPINDIPVANDQTVVIEEDTPGSITLTATDVDTEELNFDVKDFYLSGGTLSGIAPDLIYAPHENYIGEDSFTFTVSDGIDYSEPATVTIAVESVADAPVAENMSAEVDEGSSVQITLFASDVDNDELTYNIVSEPASGTLSGTAPNLEYTPDEGFNGSDSFTFTADDGELVSDQAVVSISVYSVNDEPVADEQMLSMPAETDLAITLTGSDADGDSLTYEIARQPANGTLAGQVVEDNSTFIYTPYSGFTGDDSFDFYALDGNAYSQPVTVSITVTGTGNGCSQRYGVSSTESDELIQARFANSGPSNISIYWISTDGQESDYQGSPSPLQIVEPGEVANLSAYLGYIFLILDDEYRCQGIVEATEPNNYFSFGDGSIEIVEVNDQESSEEQWTGEDEATNTATQLTPTQIASGCGEHGKIASEELDGDAKISITNSSPESLYIYWVDFNGADGDYTGNSASIYAIEPGCIIEFSATRGSVYSALDEYGQCVGMLKARESRNSTSFGEGGPSACESTDQATWDAFKQTCPEGMPGCSADNQCSECDASCGDYCQNTDTPACGPQDCMSCLPGYEISVLFDDGSGECIPGS